MRKFVSHRGVWSTPKRETHGKITVGRWMMVGWSRFHPPQTLKKREDTLGANNFMQHAPREAKSLVHSRKHENAATPLKGQSSCVR